MSDDNDYESDYVSDTRATTAVGSNSDFVTAQNVKQFDGSNPDLSGVASRRHIEYELSPPAGGRSEERL